MSIIFQSSHLIHVANIFFLLSFAVRDVFLLRILFILGSINAMGFYYFQPVPLWGSMGWSTVYICLHTYWIIIIILERRSIDLTPDEAMLHKLALGSLNLSKFITLVSLGHWRDGKAGEFLFRKDQKVSEVCIPISGKLSAHAGTKQLGEILPGQLLGTAVVLTSGIAPCDIVIDEPCRYIAWDFSTIKALLVRDPALQSQIMKIVNNDLAEKVTRLASSNE